MLLVDVIFVIIVQAIVLYAFDRFQRNKRYKRQLIAQCTNEIIQLLNKRDFESLKIYLMMNKDYINKNASDLINNLIVNHEYDITTKD